MAYQKYNEDYADLHRCTSVQDILDMVKTSNYSLEIKKRDLILNVEVIDGYYAEYSWGFEISSAILK